MPKLRWRHIGVVDGKFSEDQSAIDHLAIEELHDQQQRAIGCSVDRMDLTQPPILCSYVCEKDGVISGGLYIEAIAEICFIGTDPEVTASARRCMLPIVTESLKKRGIRWLRVFIPKVAYSDKFKTLADRLIKPMRDAGFINQDQALSHFSKDLREKK